jgi:hypothetical protein
MDDGSEKIVNLAREMLRSELVVEPPELAVKTPISSKILCLATMLAALGSSAVTDLIDEVRRPLTRYERVELDALVFYAARLKGVDKESLRREVENRIGVNDFADLTGHDYRIAKTYLQSTIR